MNSRGVNRSVRTPVEGPKTPYRADRLSSVAAPKNDGGNHADFES